MQLVRDIKSDIKAAQKLRLGWRGIALWMVFSLAVIIVFDQFGRLSMALPTLNCIAVVILIAVLRWELRRYVWFWIAMTVIVALHALLIWYVPWTERRVPALAIAAIDSADFIVMLTAMTVLGKILNPMIRLFKF